MNKSDKKMAVCFASYKRFPDAIRQIYSCIHQTYQNFDLFVAIKGLSEFSFDHLKEQFQEFVDSGKLTLRYFSNKNQLSNFLDTIRDCDISHYDLFVKLDDDDFYHKDYLKQINECHKSYPDHYCSYYSNWAYTLTDSGSYQILHPEYLHIFGPTIVLSPMVLKILLENESCPEEFLTVNEYLQEYSNASFGFTEDQLMHRIMMSTGYANRADYLKDHGYNRHLIVNRSNPSVMRGKYVSSDFWSKHAEMNPDPTLRECIYELSHPNWHDILICYGDIGKRAGIEEVATILENSDEAIVLKWHRWGIERFNRNEAGLYIFAEESSNQ